MSSTGVALADEGEQMAVFQSGGKGDGVLVWGVWVAGGADHKDFAVRQQDETVGRIRYRSKFRIDLAAGSE